MFIMVIILIKMVFASTIFLLVFILISKFFKLKLHKNYNSQQKKQDEYKKLWKLSSILPLESTNNSFNLNENLYEISNQLRDWYLTGGAIILSKNTREMYGIIQDELNTQVRSLTNKELKKIDYYYIKSLFRILNKELTNEMIFRSNQLFK